ncbi:L-threonylcarbamoyladenylate synthase [Scatolibacter rhodanostii]|uniref:L-threonylcarbamoyladenylate synthase n=1 Tax=Scatolibacter rhodanostii TaxID=2014781 RepID=UPI0013563571|nr:L-threonylcarbamoyladenylate synthase [Scatolibacter rhodanostii]
MNTIILDENNPQDIQTAGKLLHDGGLVVIPTETVYGLAADALNPTAVSKIFEAKGRPNDNPLIVHISDLSQLPALVKEIPESALRLADAFWPGPLTMIFPKSELIPYETSGKLETVAIRFPSNKTALAVINAAGTPLAAPSANLSGKPSPTTFSHVKDDLNGRVDAIINGKDCEVGVESTVITLVGDTIKILRPGGITKHQLESVLGHVEVDSAVVNPVAKGQTVSSPGMKYMHYSPKADITIIDGSPFDFVSFVNQQGDCHALCFEEDTSSLGVPFVSYGTRYDGEKQAQRLFSALHELDEKNAKTVYARIPSKNGVGLAVYNRLVRAAGFQICNPEHCYVIGLTGPSGSGKTTVCQVMNQLGAAIIDCDEVSKSPAVYDKDCLQELQNAFGSTILKDGKLQRKELAKIAFASDDNRKKLNAITHPRILAKVWEMITQAKAVGKKLIVVDAPTLFESGLDEKCARILVVTAKEETRIHRIMQRDNLTFEEAELRIKAQKPPSFYLSRADHIISGDDGSNFAKRLTPIVNGLLQNIDHT